MFKDILSENIIMNAKYRDEISKIYNDEEANPQPNFELVVSEGSEVVLHASDLIRDVDNTTSNPVKNYLWNPITDISYFNNSIKDNSTFSFTAPYVKGINPYTTLKFELTIPDKEGKKRNSSYNANVIVKRVHRAIVFQGGVALGAYETGAYQAIVEKLVKNDEDKKRDPDNDKRPLFDIIAGTSIGAMNAAIIVSSVTEEGKSLEDPKNWEDSVKKVIKFWRTKQQLPTFADFLDMNPFYRNGWDILHITSRTFKDSFIDFTESYSNINPDLQKWCENMMGNLFLVEPNFWKDSFINGWYIPSSAESARRYYSAKQFLHTVGPLHVASGIFPWLGTGKFFDIFEQSNYIPRPDNKHYVNYSLKRTLERFVDFPIKTSPYEKDDTSSQGENPHDIKKKGPRLLLVTVDVKTGDAVTFDSYSNEAKYNNENNIIRYDDGINIEHALATGAFPDFFDYPKFKVEIYGKNEERIFWDGGFRSNTPLREVLQAHRDYWLSEAGYHKQKEYKKIYDNVVPDLEVYIADLWPSELKEDPISFDRDFVENKKWNLILGRQNRLRRTSGKCSN